MADFNLNIMAEEAGRSIPYLEKELLAEINRAIQDTAKGAYALIVSQVQKRESPPAKRAEYLSALKLSKISGGYMISLGSSWATSLEDGTDGYSVRDLLLRSKKIVDSGIRAGKPWVQTSATGKKFAHVPFQKHPFAKDPSGNMDQDILKITTKNMAGRRQRFTQVFKDLEGNRIVGKVATVSQDDLDRRGITDKNLVGLTRYQQVTDSGRNASFYVVFRTVSENGKDWRKKPTSGYGIFKQAERYVQDELDNIVETLLD